MNIVIIGPVYPYRGGIAHSTMLLARALDRQHVTRVISFSRQYPAWLYPGASDRDPSGQPLQVEAEYLLDPLYPWTWLRAARRIAQEKTDLVIIQWWTTFWGPAFATLTWALKRRGVRVIYLIHNVLPHEQRIWDRALALCALRQADHCITLSERERDRLQALLPGAAVSVTHLPIFTTFANQRIPKNEARRQLGLSADVPVLLFFGIVRPYKGLRYLLEAAAQLRSAGQPFVLLIAGEFWEPLADYQALIARLGLEAQVKIEPRYIPNEAVGVYFSAADVFVAPYTGGTQSAIVKIALAFDLPIVISRAIASAELTSDNSQRLRWTPPANSEALASAILDCLRAPTASPDQRPHQRPRPAGDADWDAIVTLIESIAAPDSPAMASSVAKPGGAPHMAAVVVNWNRASDTLDCLDSLTHQEPTVPRLIVIDNGSTDGSAQRIGQAFPQAELILSPTNLGFARAANLGIRCAFEHGADFVLLLNNDAILAPNGMEVMLSNIAEDVGIVAPVIYYADHPNRIWSGGGRTNGWTLEKFDRLHNQADSDAWRAALEQDFVTLCAALIPRATLDRVGMFDERFEMYYEDMDFSRRVRRAGLRILVVPEAKVWHRVSASSGGTDAPPQLYAITRASVIFFRKHATIWQAPVIIAYRLGSALKKSIQLIKKHHFEALKAYWRGLWDGLLARPNKG